MAEKPKDSATKKQPEVVKERHYITNSTINSITLPEGVTTNNGKGVLTFKGYQGRVIKISDPAIQKAIEEHPKFNKDIHRVPTKEEIADKAKQDQQADELKRLQDYTRKGLITLGPDSPDHVVLELAKNIGISTVKADNTRHTKAKLVELIQEKLKTEEIVEE